MLRVEGSESARTLEGNEAQEGGGSRRPATVGGCPRSDWRSKAPRSRVVASIAPSMLGEEVRRHNGEGATVAVMRCGCQRENFFEGCEGRSGDAVVDRTRASSSSEVPGGERRLRSRNAANPFRYRDATSPGLFCGASRRGGAKPRGRNMSTGWNRAAEVGGDTGGSGRSRACRTRGDSHDESHERQEPRARATASDALRAHPGRSGDGAKYTRGARAREDPEDPPGDRQGREGSSQSNSCYRVRGRNPPLSKARGRTDAP